ncbi:hypothetical protein [Undibacterium sp. YM2]|uniref:hypothetical protein n=1 Tax=Undibacterium sp. YM2 TaxID=2058625 RepID=UPI001E33DD95|nr:hypothetical protein [Undibacterium sp. YM2]
MRQSDTARFDRTGKHIQILVNELPLGVIHRGIGFFRAIRFVVGNDLFDHVDCFLCRRMFGGKCATLGKQ